MRGDFIAAPRTTHTTEKKKRLIAFFFFMRSFLAVFILYMIYCKNYLTHRQVKKGNFDTSRERARSTEALFFLYMHTVLRTFGAPSSPLLLSNRNYFVERFFL